jgi:hypothetical protein
MMAPGTCPPLLTFCSLVRICEGPLPGSEGVAAEVLQRGMGNIYEILATYDIVATLAAYQVFDFCSRFNL